MTGKVFSVVLPFAVLKVLWLHEYPGAVMPGPVAVATRIFHSDHHRVGDLAGPRRAAIASDVGDDDVAVAGAELGAVILADLQSLGETEGLAEPGDRLAHIGIDQDGDDGGCRDRAVRLHGGRLLDRPPE